MPREEQNYWTQTLRNRLSRRGLLKAGLGGGAALWAASTLGCQTETAKPAQGTGTPGASNVKTGGSISLFQTTESPNLDPHRDAGYQSIDDLGLCSEGLLKTSEPTPGDLQIVGVLAESWEQPDETTAVFKLRKGVKWQNVPPVNAREFTSDDVKYNFERMVTDSPEYNLRSIFEVISKVEAPDKYTSKFTLKEASAPFLMSLTNPWAVMVPKELGGKGDEIKKGNVVGTGPFILQNYERGVALSYKKNPDYWKQDRPYMNGAKIRIIPDASTYLAAFRGGEIDITGVSPAEIENLKKSNPNISVYQYGVGYNGKINLNCGRKPFDDIRVRRAVKLAIDIPAFISQALDYAKQTGPIQYWLKDYALSEDELKKGMPKDLDKAKQLLAEAGYANGLKVVHSAFYDTHAILIKDQLAKIGIDTEIKMMEFGAWRRSVYAGNLDYEMTTTPDWAFEDPDRTLYAYYHSKGSQNNTAYKNAKVDELLEKQRRTLNKEERRKLIFEVQRILIDEAPTIWTVTSIGIVAVQPWVKNWLPHAAPESSWRQYGEVWLDK